MGNTFETAELTFPSGLTVKAQRILTEGGAEDDKPEGWISLTIDDQSQTFIFGVLGPAPIDGIVTPITTEET